jgi:2-hydroxy-6-oxonona-2,4-dienedioate hydrolase
VDSVPALGTVSPPFASMAQFSALGDLARDAPDLVVQLDASARRLTTPCGEGRVLWRMWGQGPAVVLFHGAFGSWTHWLKSIPALAAQYRIIVPDLPGFGDSDLPPEPCSFDSIARILSDGLEEILPTGELVAFVGFSFGGQMAARCARDFQQRARQVVLVSSSNLGIVRGKPEAALSWRRLTSREERDAAHRHNLETMMFHDPAKIDKVAVWLQRCNAERSRLRISSLGTQSSLRAVLAELRCWISFVCGDEDPRCKPSLDLIEETLNAISPDPGFVVLRGQGHWLSYEAPDMLNRVLLALLAHRASASFEDSMRVHLP